MRKQVFGLFGIGILTLSLPDPVRETLLTFPDMRFGYRIFKKPAGLLELNLQISGNLMGKTGMDGVVPG